MIDEGIDATPTPAKGRWEYNLLRDLAEKKYQHLKVSIENHVEIWWSDSRGAKEEKRQTIKNRLDECKSTFQQLLELLLELQSGPKRLCKRRTSLSMLEGQWGVHYWAADKILQSVLQATVMREAPIDLTDPTYEIVLLLNKIDDELDHLDEHVDRMWRATEDLCDAIENELDKADRHA